MIHESPGRLRPAKNTTAPESIEQSSNLLHHEMMNDISSKIRVEVPKHSSYSPFMHETSHDLELPTNIH
jgi:hypothetical protein